MAMNFSHLGGGPSVSPLSPNKARFVSRLPVWKLEDFQEVQVLGWTFDPNVVPRMADFSWVSVGSMAMVVSSGDVAAVCKLKMDGWLRIKLNRHTLYVAFLRGRGGGRRIYGGLLHRLLLGVTDQLVEVDHKNHNGLDNRRENMRLASRSQNMGNRRKQLGSSRFKGVCWRKEDNKWRSRIKTNPGRSLGLYSVDLIAADKYDQAARTIFGEFALTNFPPPQVHV